ncbi:MAG: NlpC/P60 family protein [Candidatus Pelethousia sp.]|nr:NlpC/P60 family protein [Candidatus Pelethousia sp.]
MPLQVISPYAPLFCKPCDQAEQDDEAWFGQTAEILEELEDGWLRVRMEYGYESYVESRHVGPAPAAEAYKVVHVSWGDVLAAPRYQAPARLTLPKGSRVAMLQENNGWACLALPGGEAGYIRACHLSNLPEKPKEFDAAVLRGKIADEALSYLHCQYRWGGRTPAGVDCSGLCHAAYLLCGVAIYRNARMESGYPVREISRARLQIGDLLYFPGHIAIYLGGGRYIHAAGSSGGVCINSLRPGDRDYRDDLAETFLCAGSIFPL